MDKSLKSWINSTKAWLKTQQTNIDSCTLAIKHAEEQIKLLTKAIQLEKAEMKLKVHHRDFVKSEMDRFIKESKK